MPAPPPPQGTGSGRYPRLPLLRQRQVVDAQGCSTLFIAARPRYGIVSGDFHSEIWCRVRCLHGYPPICVFCVHLRLKTFLAGAATLGQSAGWALSDANGEGKKMEPQMNANERKWTQIDPCRTGLPGDAAASSWPSGT